MYFAYGWPKVLSVGDPAFKQDVVSLTLDNDFSLIVFTGSAQVWAGGQHRVKLGAYSRTEESMKAEGLNKQAFWCSSRRLLAVLTYNNYLHIYGMHTSKESALQGAGIAGMKDLKHVDLFLQHSIAVQSAAAATCIVGDSRSILLGLADGTCQVFSWQSKFRGQYNPFGSLAELQLRMQRSMSLRSQRSSLPPVAISTSQHTLHHSRLTQLASPTSQSSSPTFRSQIGRAASADRLSRTSPASPSSSDSICIESMEYSSALKQLGIVLADGRCAICRTSEHGLAPAEQIEFSHWICGVGSGATCLSIAPDAQLVAVGLTSGEVALYKLFGHKGGRFSIDGSQAEGPVRVISLLDWGYGSETTGSVAELKWSPDNRAFAVGWRRKGLAIWSASGCRLMCSLRQTAQPTTPARTPRPATSGDSSNQSLENGVAAVAWGPWGYKMMVAEVGSTGHLLELSLAKSLPSSHRVAATRLASSSLSSQEVHLLQADDRLLMVSEASSSTSSDAFQPDAHIAQQRAGSHLAVQHIRLPQQYVGPRYPLLHAAISQDGMDIAVAGTQGLGLYSRRSSRWRLFGDISQEREIMVQRLLWLPRMVLVCACVGAGAASDSKPTNLPCHLLIYPRSHLDHSSLLARHPLPQVPVAMDALGSYVLIAFAPLELTLLHVLVSPASGPNKAPSAKLHTRRQLSIMTVGQPITDIAIVEPVPSSDSPGGASLDGSVNGDLEPQHCVLLRAGGQMSVLDMAQGSEMLLADDIESFWLSGPCLRATDTPAAETTSSQLERAYSQESSALSHAPSIGPSVSRHPSTSEVTSRALGFHSASTNSLQTSQDGDADGFSGHAGPAHVRTHPASDTPAEQMHPTGEVEIPWWTYGARGMQLWFPSSLAEPLSPSVRDQQHSVSTDPELEFDREVYPIGISISEVAIIGVTQRMTRSAARLQGSGTAHSSYPCWQPLPESQPVLPCLLRRLLQKGKAKEALSLATAHSQAPHFPRSLEWLLFTSLEINNNQMARPESFSGGSYQQHLGMLEQWIDSNGHSAHQGAAAQGRRRKAKTAGPLLQAAAQLIRQFPAFRDVVVSVARKTDAQMWPALFAAVGSPSSLLEALLDVSALQSAACCLLIVDRIQGAEEAHGLALRLIKASLDAAQYDLASELLRFLIPPGDDDVLAAVPSTANQQHIQPSSSGQDAGMGGWLASWLWAPSAPTDPHPRPTPTSFARSQADQQSESQASATGSAAWDIMAAHGWALLQSGLLQELTVLGHCLAAVGGRLDSLMVAAAAQGAEKQKLLHSKPTAEDVISGLQTASEQLPVVGDPKLQADVHMLLTACQAAGAIAWALPLSLLLEDTASLAGLKKQHPQLWRDVKLGLHEQDQLTVYLDVMSAADAVRLPGVAASP